jgi:MFS family permease
MALAMVAAGIVAGNWTAAHGPRFPMAVGCALSGGGMFVVDALLKPDVSSPALAAALAVVGFGLGLALVAVTAAVLSIVPPERSGMAASTVNTSRQLGGVLAVAVLGSVVNAQIVGRLDRQLTELGVPAFFHGVVLNAVTHGGLPANASEAAQANPIVAANRKLVDQVLASAKADFGEGLHIVLVIAAVVLLTGTVVSLLAVSGRRALVEAREGV